MSVHLCLKINFGHFSCLDSVQVPAYSPQQLEDSPQVLELLHASSLNVATLIFSWLVLLQNVASRDVT
jgi:hypothetical protein